VVDTDIESLDPAAITVDVLVVGAGSAGVAAAVAAAEEGAATLLVEASGAVGGTLSGQLLEHSAGFHDVHSNQVIAGFGQRLVDRLVEAGASPVYRYADSVKPCRTVSCRSSVSR
jgi:ribulose 1,5-bisphosphate synthetase/thiazole synthase